MITNFHYCSKNMHHFQYGVFFCATIFQAHSEEGMNEYYHKPSLTMISEASNGTILGGQE